jgi:diguanylate cyclase (GGDEF)-like protein
MSSGSMPETPPGASPGNHFSCSMTAVLLGRVHDHGGDAAVAEVLQLAASPRLPAYLMDITNWISFGEGIALWRAGARVTRHPQFARAVGEDAARRLNGSPVATLLRSLGSPENVYGQIATTATKYSTASVLETTDCGPGYAELRATPVPGFPRDADHCAWTCGLLSQPTILFGLPAATVYHERCAAYGAPACEYRVTWPVLAEAGERNAPEEIELLHHQLDAMKERLDSMFQTASDLIGSSDVDDILARIADRAAIEVRAPRHLLAVRMTPDGPVHCHHKGFSAEEVPSHIERLLADEPATVPDSWLVVPVCSNRRDYGRLLATSADGAKFFPQERELLEVYARYAASALDGATALLEAEDRNAQSSALLELARALAVAGTSAEIARRLADAVPAVVDCDRVAVHVWDPVTQQLGRQAIAPAEYENATQAARYATWSPLAGGVLESLLNDPDPAPVFIDAENGDPRVVEIFSSQGFTATIIVPLAAPGQFLGMLAVSVKDRPERLKPTDELLNRLSGVGAQATTALQNGRLVDVITHQALHDQLTGLANRLQFTNELRGAMQRALESSERGALFYVDLDQFKPVNDEFGHEIGDQLLVAVAERLKGCTRDSDIVARLGGDEFAVLLPSAGEQDIARVSERIMAAFRNPFAIDGHRLRLGVSIGRSLYPLDADDADGLLRHADAAMFINKRAHQAGRLMLHQRQAPV